MNRQTEYQSARQKRVRRRRLRRRLILCAPPVLLALVIGFMIFRPRAPVLSAEELGLPGWVTVDLLPVNEWSRPGTPLDAVNGIVVHYVGNPGTTAAQNRSYFESLASTHAAKASSNFLIGLDGEVLLSVPPDEVAYCSNERNSDTLSIECCHPDADGAFTDATYDSLVRLVAFLCDSYGLSRQDVIRHYDVTGKQCPLYFVEHPDAWEAFLDDVEAYESPDS